MPELSICVLHYNRWDLTRDCLASIDAQEIPCSYEKVLVDNGSTQDRFHGIGNGWRLVTYGENRGHIVGQNRCFESAQGAWVLFVANDVRLQPGCIRTLWEATWNTTRPAWYNGYGNFVIFQPTLLTSLGKCDNLGLLWLWPGYGVSNRQADVWNPSSFSGSCYLLPKSVWERVGRFDERLATSHEDIELSLRCRRNLNVWPSSVLDARATHLGNATLRQQSSHTRAAFHRDRLYVLRKHYRGVDYWTRFLAVQLLDSLPRPPQRHQRSA